MPDILQGIRVLELGQVFAAPFAGAILADLGARVIKVERPDGGDDARRMGAPNLNGDALNFHIFNCGKQSLALDLKSAHGQAIIAGLLGDTDILISNLRPGVLKSLGLDSATLCARHPRLIHCEISAFGDTGPLAMLPGYEPIIQAFSGLSSINGGPDDPPMRMGASICDQGSGMWLVIGALALLQRRARTGRGGHLSTSLLETALGWMAQKSDAYVNEGTLPPRHRSGHPDFVPYQAFDTADQPVLICCGNNRLFARLARELQQPHWVDDPRFQDNQARLQNKAALVARISAILAQAPRHAWIRRLQACGVPCAPINGLDEALREPQVRALGQSTCVPQTELRLTDLPLSIDGMRATHRTRAPLLGEHNALYDEAARDD